MIPKAELKRIAYEQEKRLKLIYKYNPSLEYLEENVPVLKSLGLEERHIQEIVVKGYTPVINSIINPLTGEDVAISVEDISIREEEDGKYGVFIGNIPYKEFFSSKTLLSTARIEELSKDNPEIRALYDENRRLKKLLSNLEL